MEKVNIRTLTHSFSRYLKLVKNGQRITILERNVPVADIVPHNENLTQAGWQREIKAVEINDMEEDYVERIRADEMQ